MLKLKLQYFGHLMQRTDSLEKTLMLAKVEGKRRREQQRMRWLDSIANSVDMDLSSHCFIVLVRPMSFKTQGRGSIASKLEPGFKPRTLGQRHHSYPLNWTAF